MTARRRVNVNFSDQAFRTLESLSGLSGKSRTEVLSEALSLKAWFDETRNQGNRVLVEMRSDGAIREVMSV